MKQKVAATFDILHQIVEASEPKNDSLLAGRLGMVLYYFSMYQSFNNEIYAAKAASHLDIIFNRWNDGSTTLLSNAFSWGGSGMAYVISLLCKSGLVDIDLDTDLKELDEDLFESAIDQVNKNGDIDFLHGAMGVLHYFNYRAEETYIRSLIEQIVVALQSRVLEEANGIWISNNGNERKPQINFSLSHGLCGYLLLLLHSYEYNIQTEIIRKTVTEGIRLLLYFYRQPNYDTNEIQQFPANIFLDQPGEPFYKTRLAWCYGDLNIVWLLHKAGNILKNNDWISLAEKYGRETTKRKTRETTFLTDTQFCHGTAGVSQFYKSLYNETRLPFYQESHEFWLAKTIALLPGELESGVYKGKECDILEGLTGINMVFMSYMSAQPVSWHKALLI